VVLNYDPRNSARAVPLGGCVAAVLDETQAAALPEPFPDDFIERKGRFVMLQIAVIKRVDGHFGTATCRRCCLRSTQQWNKDLAPIWGIEPAAFRLSFPGVRRRWPAPGGWCSSTTAIKPGALAYHDLTNEGLSNLQGLRQDLAGR